MANQTQEARYLRMTTAPIPGLIGSLAVPTIISMMVTSIYNMADTYFVSQINTSASAAVGVVFALSAIIQAVGFMLGMGSGNYISRLLGMKNQQRAEQVAATGFLTALGFGTLLAAVGIVFNDGIVRLLGATETVTPYAKEYAQYILIGAPWMTASFVLNNLLRAQGNAMLSMVGLVTGSVLNIVLDPILIFAFDMGIAGAAIATIFSQLVSFILLWCLLNGKRSIVTLRLRRFAPQWSIYKEIFRVGLPSFYRQGLAAVASAVLARCAGPFGDEALAAMSIVARVNMFALSALIGFGQGFQPVCGYNYGAGLYHRVTQAFWFCVKVGTVGLSVLAAVGFAFAPQIMAIFRSDDAAVIAIGALSLRILCASVPLMSFIILANMFFQSMGRGVKATVMSLCQNGICYVPALIILTAAFDLLGLQMAQAVANAVTFLIAIPLTVDELRKMKARADGAEKA